MTIDLNKPIFVAQVDVHFKKIPRKAERLIARSSLRRAIRTLKTDRHGAFTTFSFVFKDIELMLPTEVLAQVLIDFGHIPGYDSAAIHGTPEQGVRA